MYAGSPAYMLRYQQQSLDYNQHEGGKRQSQRRYFLSSRPPARNRYKD